MAPDKPTRPRRARAQEHAAASTDAAPTDATPADATPTDAVAPAATDVATTPATVAADGAAPAPQDPVVAEIPIGMRRAAAWSWRILLVIALIGVVVWGMSQLMSLVVPVLVAVLFASLLNPFVSFLMLRTPLGQGLASGVVLLGTLVVVGAMLALAGNQLISQFRDVQDKAVTGFRTAMDWVTQTMGVDTATINKAVDELVGKVQENSGTILSGAMSGVSTLGNLLTGTVIALFTLFFLMAGGANIWRWCVRLLPSAARPATHEAVRRGWKALSAYMRTQVLVAAVDATGIAIGMVCLGLAGYAVPVWLIVFLFSFVPIVGAVVSGAVAVLLVLVLKGWVLALVMVGVVLAVQQIEGNVLQPFLMGKAVELHPLAVFLGVAAGSMVAGIPGALFAIPLIAFVNATVLYLSGRDPSPDLGTDEVAAKAYAPSVTSTRRS